MKKLAFSILAALTVATSCAYAEDNRVDFSLGVFSPSGKSDDLDTKFKAGVNLGVGYTRFLTENFGVGGFMDYSSFYPKEDLVACNAYGYGCEKQDVLFSSLIIGVQAVLQAKIGGESSVYAAFKPGIGLASLSSDDLDYSGTGGAFILEGGFRHLISAPIELGATVKYTNFSADIENNKGNLSDKVDVDASGVAIAVSLGIVF